MEARRSSGLGVFIDCLISSEADDVSERTVLNWRATQDKLSEFFGDDAKMRAITEDDASAWHEWLGRQKTKNGNLFAAATISGHVKRAKRFFNAAAKAKYIERSPFIEIKAGSQVNDEPNHTYLQLRSSKPSTKPPTPSGD